MADDLFNVVLPYVGERNHRHVVKKVFSIFEDQACDTMCELVNHSHPAVRKHAESLYEDDE